MEFLIKRTDGDWFDLRQQQFDEALRPSSYSSNRIPGWGDHRIVVEGCEVSFSYEDPGIQVVFECPDFPEDKAAIIVREIAQNISSATGQGSAVVAL